MWNLLESRDLFTSPLCDQGNYHPDAHLAEMIALFGSPPKELIDRAREGLRWKWTLAVQNSEGESCKTASEWYGGPLFDESGMLSYPFILFFFVAINSLPGLFYTDSM